ncbi:hypothetical protein SPFM20_00120 [Salmonella phage SPFM20]|nr:hypothetical protein SPFM20_00120 [Salmonella phage SPFM20]
MITFWSPTRGTVKVVKQQPIDIHFIECDITWLHVDVRNQPDDTPLQKVHDYIAANPNEFPFLYAESGSMHKFGNAFDATMLQFFINQEKPKGGDWQTRANKRFGRMVILTSSQQQRSLRTLEGAIRFLNPLLLISLQQIRNNPANFALKELMPQEYIAKYGYLNIKRAFLTAP